MKKSNSNKADNKALSQTSVSVSSFEHYMIYVNGRFVEDVYLFAEVQDYYNKYFLYGKITYEKV